MNLQVGVQGLGVLAWFSSLGLLGFPRLDYSFHQEPENPFLVLLLGFRV